MNLNEVPIPVIESVLQKWEQIQNDGKWNQSIWKSCEMCHFIVKHMKELYINTSTTKCALFCPLSKDKWCNEIGYESRLSIRFHLHNSHTHETINRDEANNEWLISVQRFVMMLKKHLCNRSEVCKVFNDMRNEELFNSLEIEDDLYEI